MKIQNPKHSRPLIWEWKNKLKLPLLFKVILNSESPWYNMEMIVLSWFGHCAQSQLIARRTRHVPSELQLAVGYPMRTQSSWTHSAPWAMLAVAGNKCTLVRVRGISTAGSFPPEINKNSKAAAFREKYASSFGTGGKMGQSPHPIRMKNPNGENHRLMQFSLFNPYMLLLHRTRMPITPWLLFLLSLKGFE